MKSYCAICDTEATKIIPNTNTLLCGTCATAYEWGQVTPDVPLERNEDYITVRVTSKKKKG